MEAFRLPQKSAEEKNTRKAAIEEATKNAIMVPFMVMETAYESMEVMAAMAESGNPNSVSDAGVGALATRACVRGAFLNVKINTADLEDKAFVEDILNKSRKVDEMAEKKEKEILGIVERKL